MELDHPQSQNDLKHWTFWRCFMNIPGIVTQLARWNPPKKSLKVLTIQTIHGCPKIQLGYAISNQLSTWQIHTTLGYLGADSLWFWNMQRLAGISYYVGLQVMSRKSWIFCESRKNKHIRSVKIPRFPWSLDEYQVNNYAKHTGCKYHPWKHPKGSWRRTQQILIPLRSVDLSAMRFTTMQEGFRRWIHIACWC